MSPAARQAHRRALCVRTRAAILAAAIALTAACAAKPACAVCASHAECPSGSTCQQGVCQEGLALDFALPAAARAYATTALPIQLSVAGSAPATVQLVVDERTVAAFAPPFAGTLDVSTLAEGAHALYASAELGGRTYRSPLRTVEVDRTAPAVPAIAAATTNAADPVAVTGTLAAEAAGTPVTLTVYEGAAVKASGIVARDGVWSAPIPLAEGRHVLTARAVDAAGNASALSAEAAIVVDRTPPPVPTMASTTTREANPVTVSGTFPAAADGGTPVTLTLSEGASVLAAGVAPGGGTWSAALDLAEGTHTLTVRAVDAAGNGSTPSSPATIVVDRTAPATPTITAQVTNAGDPVTVSGTARADAGTAVTVTLSEGTRVLAPNVAPTGATWAAAVPLAEGTHLLTARAVDAAGNLSDPSPVTTVVVDRTAPSITGHDPADLATNVWTRDPITVTFSEPIDDARVTDATVILARSGGAPVAKTFALSPDRRTLTVTPAARPAVPDTFTLALSGLADPAGNLLPTSQWSWTAPEWQDLGIATQYPYGNSGIEVAAVAVPPSGLPVVAMQWTAAGPATGFSLVRYTGEAAQWAPLPPPPLDGVAYSGSLVAGERDLFAAFASSGTDPGTHLWTGRFDGTAWRDTGLAGAAPAYSQPVSLALDEAGAPYVTWVEGAGTATRVFAGRWAGAAWTRLGAGALDGGWNAAGNPTAAQGAVRVAWSETDSRNATDWHTRAWSGTGWDGGRTSPLPPSAVGKVLARATGSLVLLMVNTSGKLQVHFDRPDQSGAQLGGDLNVGPGIVSAQTMALDAAGEPVVAWYEDQAGIEVKRYDPLSGWRVLTSLPLTPRHTLSALRVAASSAGVIAVATIEYWPPGGGGIRVWRYNR